MSILNRLSPLLGLAALILTAAVIGAVASGRGAHITATQGPLGAAHCPDGARDRAAYRADKPKDRALRVLAAGKGCNATPAAAVTQVRGELTAQAASLRALGLPAPTGPVSVRLQRTPSGLRVHAHPGLPGGFELDPALASSQRRDRERVALAELALADVAPGLDAGSRRRAAVAYMLLSAATPASAQAARKALRTAASAEIAGAYDAWTIAHAPQAGAINAALKACRTRCAYPRALAGALTARHADPDALRARFLRLLPAARRAELARVL